MVTMKTFSSREEWLDGRSKRIGGSDAGCILGLNNFSTNVDLWKLKTGRTQAKDISDNPYVTYGNKAEPLLRELFALDFEEKYKVEYAENNLWLNDRYPFAHASLDGWLVEKGSGRMGVFENKTTFIKNATQFGLWKERIPDSYYAQVLHYLMVTEFKFAVLNAQLKFVDGNITTKRYFIERDEVEDEIKFLEDAEREFYDAVVNDRQPPLKLPQI